MINMVIDMANKINTPSPIIGRKQSRYGFNYSQSKGKKVNYGAGGNRKKPKISLPKIKGIS